MLPVSRQTAPTGETRYRSCHARTLALLLFLFRFRGMIWLLKLTASSGRVLTPLRRALERTEWNTICHMSWCCLVADIEQTPCSPRKTVSYYRKRTCVGPIFFLQEDRTARPNGPTERPDRTGANKVLFWWRLTSPQMEVGHFSLTKQAVAVSWHAQKVIVRTVAIWLARPKILDGPFALGAILSGCKKSVFRKSKIKIGL